MPELLFIFLGILAVILGFAFIALMVLFGVASVLLDDDDELGKIDLWRR